MKKNCYKVLEYLGYILFGFGIAAVFYYIWSPLFTAEFQSDTAEMLLWAQQIIEKHTLISPDFSYSYTIPFGGHLILAPFVKIFGVRIISLRAGMSVIALGFLVVFFLFFKELFGKKFAPMAAGILTLLLCGVRSMRELFWSHMVFYSLSVFCWMLIALLLRQLIIRELSAKKRTLYLSAVFLLTLFACATGTPMLIYFAIPFFSSMIICSITDFYIPEPEKTNKKQHKQINTVLIMMLAAILFGFMLSFAFHGDPMDNYSDYYTVLSKASDWPENLQLLIPRWINLFTELNDETVSLTSAAGVRMSLMIIMALIVIALDVSALFIVRKFNPFERFLTFFHWILTMILLFFFCFGTISNYERRLIPIFVSGIITAIIMIRYLLQSSDYLRKINAGLLGLALVFTALIDGISLFALVPDNSLWYEDGSIMQTLVQNGLTDGYSTDFWFANSITVMTGEQIRVREVTTDKDGQLVQKKNQTDIKWYQEDPERENTFLICQEWFVHDHPEYLETADKVFRSEFIHPVSKKYIGYYILFYNRDILFPPGRDETGAYFSISERSAFG